MLVSRVTNSMLKNTLLSNLGMNLTRMDKLQNQMSTGRKFGEISDDPASLVFGQAARNKIVRLTQFHDSVGTARNWLTQAESGIMELQKVIGNVYEELVSAGGVKTPDDKRILSMAVEQLQNHYVDTLNTAFGDRFVFSGYNTPGDFAENRETVIKPFTLEYHPRPATATGDPDRVGRLEPQLFFNGFNISQFDGWTTAKFNADLDDPSLTADEATALATLRNLMGDVKSLDVGPGVTMPITMNGIDVVFYTARAQDGTPIVRNTFDMLHEVYRSISGYPEQIENIAAGIPAMGQSEPKFTDDLTLLIKLVQDSQNHLLTKTAEIGGRQRRLDLLEARYDTDLLNYEQMRSDAEDADMAEVIMNLKMAEVVYQAALSAGARIIQPSLMDFLR
jgi:flagellar hook-associated protein 3 FlgL